MIDLLQSEELASICDRPSMTPVAHEKSASTESELPEVALGRFSGAVEPDVSNARSG